MNYDQKPCGKCTQQLCDYRRCDPYRAWLNEAWKQFQRYARHEYWTCSLKSSQGFVYQHPDMLRRYLQEGPCGLCACADTCDVPCDAYRCWWDARRVWLLWKLQNADV